MEPTAGAFGQRVRNPAGSKLIRHWYRAKQGAQGSYGAALEWYRTYLSAADAKVRELEAERRRERAHLRAGDSHFPEHAFAAEVQAMDAEDAGPPSAEALARMADEHGADVELHRELNERSAR